MKIAGLEILRVVRGEAIFREHPDSEFFVNDTEMMYDVRYLRSDFSVGEIAASTFYLVQDMREVLAAEKGGR